ncbi:MAG: phosphate signaling complex protein PhoU [Deltaproteobacteria bacterium]|nr:phosphate signaling complex protein PhoU [Deltaproteobacteria bacterium]
MEKATHLQEGLRGLKLKMLNMFAMVDRSVDRSIKAYTEMDEFLAEEVVEGDELINDLESEIDEYCLRILALECPVAKDLRFIVGCMRISSDLERIADEAANVAERVMIIGNRPRLSYYQDLTFMAQKAQIMLRKAEQCFNEQDQDLAVSIPKMDSEVDVLNHRIVKKIIEFMIQETPAIERSVHNVIIVRRFERIADLSTNIAENVYFMTRGINIKHKVNFDQR